MNELTETSVTCLKQNNFVMFTIFWKIDLYSDLQILLQFVIIKNQHSISEQRVQLTRYNAFFTIDWGGSREGKLQK